MTWRWDQGHLQYFRFGTLRKLAHAILELNNIPMHEHSLMRDVFDKYTGKDFSAPDTHSVWRQYARTIKCSLLATKIDNRLTPTDVCRKLGQPQASERWEIDEYFSFIISRFCYPFPGFQGYRLTDKRVYPFCALVKYLLATHITGGSASISVDEVFSKLIGNNVSGAEDTDYYVNLTETNLKPKGDQGRQVRELMIFLSQASFLNWLNRRLILDITDSAVIPDLMRIAVPNEVQLYTDRDASIIALGTVLPELGENIVQFAAVSDKEFHEDETFIEGKRVRSTHLRLERSRSLRSHFLLTAARPILCDMCNVDNDRRYPWTQDLIEIHHLLPLASSVAIRQGKTSLSDIRPLCPSCHRSIHVFYRNWLQEENVDDFRDKDQAYCVYNYAKQEICLE